MSTRPTAAKGTFPYPHRTVAEVDADALVPPMPEPEQPPLNEWVLAYWPHMHRDGGRLKQYEGWFPSRKRDRWGWQAQFGSYRTYVAAAPTLWQPLPSDHPLARRIRRAA